jgi:hypothetical protein
MLYHAVPESLKHTLPLVHRVSRYQDRMLCPSEQFAHHYRGAAIRNPTGFWSSCHQIHKVFKRRSAAKRVGDKFKASSQSL